MTGAFSVDPGALTTASAAFSQQVEPVNTAASAAESLKGSAATAGKAYASQGNGYHAAMLGMVETLLTPMATKLTWVADTLSSTAAGYQDQDQTNAAVVTDSGSGA